MIEDYIFLVVRFSLIVFLMVGNYLYDDELLNENLIVNIIQLLAKDIDHNGRGIQEINSYLRKNGFFSLNFVRTLI